MKVSDKPLTTLLTSWDTAQGKVIASVCEETAGCDEYLVFRFTDGSAILLKGRNGESCYGCIGREPDELDSSWERSARVYFGLDSLEKYMAEQQAADAKYRAESEQRERAQYEALKRKFA